MSAEISHCGQYRYLLERAWPLINPAGKTVFVMLNPSTADATEDDPTIRRCINFAKAWGSSGLIVANLYGLRSTDPRALWRHDDPVGPANDTWLQSLALQHRDIVCAWGANAKEDRVRTFVELMKRVGGELWCLGTTKAGAPRHPLYLRRDAELRHWQL